MSSLERCPLFEVSFIERFHCAMSLGIVNLIGQFRLHFGDTWDKQLEIDCNYVHTSQHKNTRMAGCSALIHSKAGEGRQRTTTSSHTARS